MNNSNYNSIVGRIVDNVALCAQDDLEIVSLSHFCMLRHVLFTIVSMSLCT